MTDMRDELLLNSALELFRDMLLLLSNGESIHGALDEEWAQHRALCANAVYNWCEALEARDNIPTIGRYYGDQITETRQDVEKISSNIVTCQTQDATENPTQD